MDINVSSYQSFPGSELSHCKPGLVRVPEEIERESTSGEKKPRMEKKYPHKKDLNQHECKICSKKFGCGRALGGHMRIHVPYDSVLHQKNRKRKVSEIGTPRYDDDCRDIMGHVVHEEFSNSSEIEEQVMGQYGNDPKTSRFVGEEALSSISLSKVDEEVANCLLMLSSAQGSWRPTKTKDLRYSDNISCEAKIKFMVKSKGGSEDTGDADIAAAEKKGIYECRTCKKVFSSHQALGGHRASHKKVKTSQELEVETGSESCHTIPDDRVSDGTVKGGKLHECGVCHRNFGSGQALGGHKRCHNDGEKPSSMQQKKPMLLLDLNMPAPLEDDQEDFYNLPNCDNKVSYYSQSQWWTDNNPYRLYPLPQLATKTA